MMEYKGYKGTANYDFDEELFYGNVITNTNAVIGYEADTIDKLEIAFKEAVNDYLDLLETYPEDFKK